MIRIICILGVLFLTCFVLGFIVSKFEKKRSWVEGHKPYGIYEKHIKRPLDFSLSLFALIIFWPILLVIAIAVRINMGSPVVFEQERPGMGGEIFKIKKFRTMSNERDDKGNLLPDDQRLTRFGRIMRKTSGDECLELFSIISGNLAIVGPRPLLKEYLPYYTEEEMHRHDVRPGLTGLSQVHGRNYTPWDTRFKYDLKYVDNITFRNDLKIILDTIKVVLTHTGVADRSNIHTDENGNTYILIDGMEHKYPKPLNIERKIDI